MSDWEKRSIKNDDVVYFNYVTEPSAFKSPLVYLWDIDKTYLDTKFETVRGLLKTATERAEQKKNIPGSAQLVLTIEDAWKKCHGLGPFPIFFITASPPQMEKKIHEKLTLDGIAPLGIFCKDNLANLSPTRLWRLNKQVGYKLQSLLQMRLLLQENAQIIMFGDDGESDAIIYSLFSDICSRRLNTSELRKILSSLKVLDNQIDKIFLLQEQTPQHDPVEKIYINLVDDTDADYYLKFGRRTFPTANSFQTALDLCQDDRLDFEHVLLVAKGLITEYGYTKEEIEKSLDDMIRREKLGAVLCEKLIPYLIEHKILPLDFAPSVPPRAVRETRGNTVISLEGAFDPWVPEHIDYLHDYR